MEVAVLAGALPKPASGRSAATDGPSSSPLREAAAASIGAAGRIACATRRAAATVPSRVSPVASEGGSRTNMIAARPAQGSTARNGAPTPTLTACGADQRHLATTKLPAVARPSA